MPGDHEQIIIPTVEQMSGLFFGSKYRLSLGMWIAQQEIGEPFDLNEAAAAYGDNITPRTGILNNLGVFVEASMIEPTVPHRPPPTVSKRWSKLENPWWGIFSAALDAHQHISES